MPRLYKCEPKNTNKATISNTNKQKKEKKSLSTYKKNTFKSLNEVESFLGDFSNFKKYIKLYKILKK